MIRRLVLLLTATAAVYTLAVWPVAATPLVHPARRGHHHYHHHFWGWGHGGGGGGFAIVGIIVLLVVVAVIVLVVRGISRMITRRRYRGPGYPGSGYTNTDYYPPPPPPNQPNQWNNDNW